MSFADNLKNHLCQAIDKLSASPEDVAVDPLRDFTRNRKLNAKDTIMTLLTMEGDCIQEELYRFFGRNMDAPTKAAFCRQRQKLSDKALPSLFSIFNADLPVSLFKGKYRLFACDGSAVEIFRDPNDPDTFFEPKPGTSSTGFNLLYINAMYSILDNRFVDLLVQPGHSRNEYTAFCSMVDALERDDLPIIYFGDMGYPAYNSYAHVIENNQYFLFRSNDRILKGILGKPVDDLREMDRYIVLIMSRSASVKRKRPPAPGFRYKHAAPGIPFDFLEDRDSLYYLPLRIVRFRLNNGTFENIITNLPDHEFDFDDFKDLYSLRWGEETAFRNIKHPLCLTAFHSKKYRNIVQEIWARAILHNFSTAVMGSVHIEKKGAKHRYQVNFSEAFKTCREYLRSRALNLKMDVAGLIARSIEPIRPGRSFARNFRAVHIFSFWYRN